ncbi:sensor histidine kinase [Actinomadura rayongensis]|uniref:histidine kinase n=1 Tax=Actinomadura rayongensis TaxID=1429076 RepID=A0A6I4W019_9ACTN|nr:histidine kinase [Actinomadura rayongensis]MXQ63929.1 sensor histidine kinase [Actinomadura rayongensis]
MVAPSVLDLAGYGAALLGGGALGRCALRRRVRRPPVPAPDDATAAALHTLLRAAPPLRSGLTRASARRAARPLRHLLGAEAVAIVGVPPDGDAEPDDGDGGGSGGGRLLVWDGTGAHLHAGEVLADALPVLGSGRPRVLPPEALDCDVPLCRIRVGVIAPIAVDGRVAGALAVYGRTAAPGRVRAVGEVARWLGNQLELADLDRARTRAAEAEMRALRAQISPHFVYNSLTTIASFVRTDPERARELLVDFADFARYSFRNPRDFTTLADELRSIDRYLLLERARFGERLHFTVEVAPEVLPVEVPFLSLQPLVENAIRHGMHGASGTVHIEIVARDAGSEAAITVEDDGVGMEPGRLREILAGGTRERGGGGGIGLANVDERLRQVYGDEYGLVVETARGAGTRVRLRVPKFRPAMFPA